MQHKVLQIFNLQLERLGKKIFSGLSFELNRDEHLLLTGPASSGKTSLAEVLVGELYAHGEICFNFIPDNPYPAKTSLVKQYYTFKNKSGLKEFYYQQRYNSQGAEDSATVREIIFSNDLNSIMANELLIGFGLNSRIDAPLIQLSSGERKKLQLINAFINPTQLMIIDNPYIGLDVASVKYLNDYLTKLTKENITIILIADTTIIPSFITHIASTNKQLSLDFQTRKNFSQKIVTSIDYIKINEGFIEKLSNPLHNIVNFNNITVKYGDKNILMMVNWSVNAGDKWLLSGHNGAGKSTLLSLINGDHPQAYANEGLYLFGKKRGSGESIWDIKRNIGFVSPELHWNFNPNASCLETVLSGFFDTPGLYQKTSLEQQNLAKEWLEQLKLDKYADMRFANLSAGIQRMILLARALVKNPPLFIFDEPTQGLDDELSQQFIHLLEQIFANNQERTMIYVSHRADQIPKCINLQLELEQGKVTKNGVYK